MDTAAIEIRGSVLERLEGRGAYLVATLRAAGGPGVQLLFFQGEAHGNVEALPVEIAAGTLEGAGGPGGEIPVPFPHPGTVELHLEGTRGERLVIVGHSLTVRPSAEGTVVTLGRRTRAPGGGAGT